MVTIQIHDLMLHGYHGIHTEERKVMNTFEVHLDVTYDEGNARFEGLGNTISYVDLFNIIRRRMEVPTPLLETICQDIMQAVKDQFPLVRSVRISVYKLQAPIGQFQGKVGVSLYKEFED